MTKPPLTSPLVTQLLKLAIEEDFGSGDITSQLTVPTDQRCVGEFLAKEDFILCGIPVVEMLYSELKFGLALTQLRKEGESCNKGDIVLKVEGLTREMLASERNALNFLQHLSAIATQARRLSQVAPNLKVMDTRKTTPGLRILEKYAVQIGGAENHRMGLGDMILVKNNHIDASGGDIQKVLEAVVRGKSSTMRWEVEVRSQHELEVALGFSPDVIMLDNMDDTQVESSVAIIRKKSDKMIIEVSGGVTESRLKTLESLGVDYVSMGALTNRVAAVDISLRIKSFK